MLNDLRRKWGHVGSSNLIMIALDYFIFIFDSVEPRDAILIGGPWFLVGNVIGLNKWSPNLNPNSLDGFSLLIWV